MVANAQRGEVVRGYVTVTFVEYWGRLGGALRIGKIIFQSRCFVGGLAI